MIKPPVPPLRPITVRFTVGRDGYHFILTSAVPRCLTSYRVSIYIRKACKHESGATQANKTDKKNGNYESLCVLDRDLFAAMWSEGQWMHGRENTGRKCHPLQVWHWFFLIKGLMAGAVSPIGPLFLARLSRRRLSFSPEVPVGSEWIMRWRSERKVPKGKRHLPLQGIEY